MLRCHILKLRKSGDAEVATDSAQNAGDAQKEGEEVLRDVNGATVGYDGFWVELFFLSLRGFYFIYIDLKVYLRRI